MAQKPTKIDDVKKPDKVAPSATARPILVASHSLMTTDPMMAPDTTETDTAAPEAATSRTAKTIKPIDANLKTSAEETNENAEPKKIDAPESPVAGEPPSTNTEAESPTTESTSQPSANEPAEEPKRDSEAEVSAAETAAVEAQVARDQELEDLIASGKYAVPINAVQRERSRMYTIMLVILALALALLLADAVLDAGLIKAPGSIPHTNFFSNS